MAFGVTRNAPARPARPWLCTRATDLRHETVEPGLHILSRHEIVITVELADAERIGAEDHYLAVVATMREDLTVQASVVNAGVLAHPVTGELVVGFVTYGRAKLSNLRRRPRATLVFRSGWRWATVEGSCEIVGPDDPLPGFLPSDLPGLLRSVFLAAGGSHDDWAEFDRVMSVDRRAVVLIRAERVYSNDV